MEIPSPVIQIFSIMLGLLLLSAITLSICKRIKIPYTVALVLLGMVIINTFYWIFPPDQYPFQWQIADELKADFVIYICLPTLIYAAAFNLDTRQLIKNILPIHILAILGFLLSTVIIGLIVSWLTPIPIAPSMLLGAILSATDPVAVVALFRRVGAPKRLTTLIEGESLFNDAVAMVSAKILFGFVLAGILTSHELLNGAKEFLLEIFGGIIVGGAVAFLFGYILGKVERNPDIELTLTTIIAYASFMIAQIGLQYSGIIATATAGLVMSGWGRTKISPSVSSYLNDIWRFLGYIANTFVFLFVGLSVNLLSIEYAVIPLCVVIFAMLISRFLVIFGLIPIINQLPGTVPINLPYKTVMYWGGLRGAIALAIVLSLGSFPQKELLITLVAGAVLFTLLVQGLTIKSLMHVLGLDISPLPDKFAMAQARLSAIKHARDSIPQLVKGGFFSGRVIDDLKDHCQVEIEDAVEQVDLLEENLSPQDKQNFICLKNLGREKKCYSDLFAKDLITENSFRYLSQLLIEEMDEIRHDEKFERNVSRRQRKSIIQKLFNTLIRNIFPINRIINHFQSQIVLISYEINWAQHQAALIILQHFEQDREQDPEKFEISKNVYNFYCSLKSQTQQNLDDIAESFPATTTEMQKQLAKKLEIHSQIEELDLQLESGSIPSEVVEHLKLSMENEIIQLGKQRIKKLSLSPKELLAKVPFFKDIPELEFDKFIDILKCRIFDQGEIVIRQGETGNSLFLIMRGVVRIIHEEKDKKIEVATLLAGDFFGEMALLHREPRTATVQAKTLCVIYELESRNFKEIIKQHPSIQVALEKVDRERREKLKNL